MKCSLGISDFLEEISSLSHSVVFLYFFALITEEGFLISPCYSLEFYIQMGISFLFSFSFCFSSFHSYLLGLLRQSFCFFAFLFLDDHLAPCLLYNVRTSVHSSSGTLYQIKALKSISHSHCIICHLFSLNFSVEKGMAIHFSILALRTP